MAKESPLPWAIAAGLLIILLIALYKALNPPIIEEIPDDSPYAPVESFEDGSGAATTQAFTFCPADTKYFIDKAGDSLCCAGEVAGNRCLGDIECTFSAPKNGIRTCGEIRTELNKRIQSNLCPASMPNYYETPTGARGCTASGLNQAGTAPVNPTMPKCPVHADAIRNATDPASCQNLRDLDRFECIVPGCKKSVMSLADAMPAVLSQTFMVDGEDVPRPRMCMDGASYARYLDVRNPAWKQDPKYALDKNISICAVAKRVFVNKEVIPGVNDVCL